VTSAEEVRQAIAESETADWMQFSSVGTWTNRDDVALRIVNHEQLESRFQAPWTHQIQSQCQSFGYLVYYGPSPVEYHVVVAVDDFRAYIPQPQTPSGPNQPFVITPYQATLGRIITGDDQTFNAYLNRTGIDVRGGPATNQG
jgi:hypothetical protein